MREGDSAGADPGGVRVGVPPGWRALATAAGEAEEAGALTARGVAVCRGQAAAVAAEGRTGTGVSGMHTGVAAPTISAIPVPPVENLAVPAPPRRAVTTRSASGNRGQSAILQRAFTRRAGQVP